MKLKQFIFAFTAMLLCFTVSVNAQVAKIGGTEYTTLADALDAAKAKTGDVTVELYEKVTLNQPLNGSFTTITFVGKDTDAEIYLDVQGYITATNKKVAFKNLTLRKSQGAFIANAGFMNVAFGVYDVAEVTYTNCTFANGAYASSGKVTYDGCTFKKSWDKYGLWAYGNVDVTVQGSTFADDRGIKMYAENGADASVEKANLTVKNTNFSAVDNKPAIVLTYGESVVLEGNTYSSTGTFELDLDGKPNGVAVTSDVAPVCVNDNGACGVLVDGKIYTTVAQAAEVATAGSTVTLLHNSTETVKFPEGVTLNKNGFTANGVTVVAVAKIGDVEYATLQAALDAAAAGTGNVTVTILADVDLTGVDWNPVTVSAPGYPVVTVEGNGKTITGLNDMLFAGTWAGKSGLIIKNLTITNSAIVNDKDDAKGTVGVGAFIGYPQASATITLENCHLKNSSVEGGHWTGGLIGMAGGYNGADGPVFMNLTIKGCSVTGSTITGKGSVGGVIGHGSCAAWTNVVIEETTVSNNTITSTGSSNVKAGAVMGTIGAAGQPTTVNGVTNTGGMSVSATVAENTVKSNGTEITTIYGRQGTETGMLYVAGGSYDNYPIEEGVAYAAPAKGYKIVENNGTYGIVEDPEYGKVAKVGDACFETLAQAVAAVEDGGTITLIANETFTKNNRYNNGGWWDGLGYSGDKSFTIDLAGFTISQDGALNDYLMWFKNDGAKANTITLKNGTLDAGTTAYCALATASSNAKKITVNLENIQLINNNSNGATLKIRGGAELNANAGTIITGKNSYLGIEAAGKTTVVNIYEGAEIYQNGTSSYCGCLAGASGNSTINVYGGYGKGVSGGFIAMTSGGTINVEGGEWIANTDGTYANGNKSVLVAQSEKGAKSIVNVTGGTFKGGYNCYGNKVGDAQINIKGGNFNADPTSYVAEDYIAVKNNGVWNVVKAAAKIGKQGYATVDAAIKAAQAGETVTIFEGTYKVPAMKAGITVVGEGEVLLEGTLSGTLENLTLKKLHIKGGNAQRWAYGKGNLVFENVTFEATSIYALHFDGIAAGTNLTYKDCTIIGWAAMGGSPASCVFDGCTIKGNGTYGVIRTYFNTTIQNCTFDVANVSTTDTYEDGIHAVEGAKVVVDNCTNEHGEMKDIVNVHGASVVTIDGKEIKNVAKAGNKYYESFAEAIAAIGAGDVVIELLADATFDYNARDAYGAAETTSVTINGNGKTLTLNQKNSDWASFGLANNSGKLVLNNMTIEKTGYGDTSGAWNKHAIIFSCPVEMNKVTVNNSIAVQAGAALNNVTINEANGYYGLWINGNGQEVTINGGAINATNGGRGIKIADQYIDAPEQVTLNVTGTKFNTAKKAAVLVSSKAGAKIAASNVNIENVAEDNVNFVWVDEDWAQYSDKVEVTGASVRKYTVSITTNGAVKYYESFAEAIAAIGVGDVVIELLADATFDYNARDAYGTAETTSVTINGNSKTLTLNQKNSDWASFGLANNSKLVLNNMIIEKTGYGDTSGAWNTHAIIFSCPVEMNDVTVNNAIAVQAGATLNNVTINEANGYYGLWINGNGQTVTVNGGSITATNGGRGIKIADQYIDAPAQVKLSVTGTVFETAQKAAVLVSSKAGADITASNVDITKVAADSVNFVWVDEDWAEYFSKVEVTGATVSVEGADSFAAAITENGAVKGYYKTLAEALTAAADGDTVTLIWSEGNAPVAMNGAVFGKTVTITGTATVDWSKGFLFVGRGGEGNATVTFDGANLTSASNSASFGIHVSGREKNTDNKYDGTVVIKNSTIELDYLINKGNMTLDNSTLTVKNGFSVGGRPASETESGEDATATVALNNGSKLVVNNHNGMGLGYEAIGVMNVDATSTFETTQSFLVTAKGTMNIAGTAIVAGTLTNKGVINLTAEGATLKAQEGLTVNSTVEGRDVSYADGVYSTKLGLKGKGTEAEPFLIGNIEELMAFRNSVNGGETKYSAPGVYVALAADIDMAGENWVGIGSMNAEHGFMGNFDGKNFTIKNLTITDPAVDTDGYAYAGLFGVTEGTDKDNQNTIKNLTIENVTITTTGHIAAAAVAYPYYTIIDNVKVCGDIAISGGDYTAGVLAYTRRCVNASNLSIVGNDGSFVKGNQTVGGVISDIQMNGGLTAVYNNFSAEGLTISGEKSVGGISGIISLQTLDGATVKNVTLSCSDARVGIVSGSLGAPSTISNVTYENVTGATNLIGATYDNAKAVAAKIGNTYYATLKDALAAVQAGETITLTEGAEGDESKTEIEFTKAIEFTITGKAPKYALPVITFQNAKVNIKDAEVLIPELDARQNATINVIDSKVVGVGGDDIIKSYYNGAINIEGKSEVYTMQVTTMGYINIKGEAKLNATWQTNVYGNGMITMAEGATFNTAALHLTGKDYSGRDNTDADRVGKPATIVVDGSNLTVGKALSNNGADYSYNSSKGINIGTVDGKSAVLDIKNGANVNFFMANGQTANIGAGGTVNIDGALSVACRGEGNVTLVNNGAINLTSEGATLKAQEGLKNIATTLPGYFVKYVDGVYTVCGEIVLVDGELTEYTNATDMAIKTLTYKRTFTTKMQGKWQTLYVPFEIPVSELTAMGYDVAYFNDFRETIDANGDIVPGKSVIEMVKINGGTLKANYPYVIRAKTVEALEMNLVLNDVTLYSTTGEKESLECSSAFKRFTFYGTYKRGTRVDFTGNNNTPVYAMNPSGGMQAMSETANLGAFRVYMTITMKNGEPYIQTPEQAANASIIPLRLIGEEDENGATIIYDVVEDSLNGDDFIYDLQGRRVSEPKKGGIYIKNGKKILF